MGINLSTRSYKNYLWKKLYRKAIKEIQNNLPVIGDVVESCSKEAIIYSNGHRLDNVEEKDYPIVGDVVIGIYYRLDIPNKEFIINIEHEQGYSTSSIPKQWDTLNSLRRKILISRI